MSLENFDIEGEYTFQSYTCYGTIIAPMNNNQQYLWSIGYRTRSVTNFSLKNICFTTSQIVINENNKYSLSDSNMFSCDYGLRIENASFGKLDNIFFNHIVGTPLIIKSSWELDIGTLSFRWCSCINNSCILLDTVNTAIYPNANLSAISINNIFIESTEGNIINANPSCHMLDTIIHNIIWEPNTWSVTNTVTNLPNSSYNDDTANKWALFNLQGDVSCIIDNISINNFGYEYETIGNEQYIYDTIIKIDSTTKQARPNFIINNIQINGMQKSCNSILQEEEKTVFQESSLQINNIKNISYYNLEYKVTNFPFIKNFGFINSLYNGSSLKRNLVHFFSDNIKLTDFNLTHYYFVYDKDSINNDRLVIYPNFNTTTGFVLSVLPPGVSKLYIRAKIENSQNYILNFARQDYTQVKQLTLEGTGAYKLYEFDISNFVSKFNDNPSFIFASNSSNTDILVYLDYFYFV